MGFKRLVNMSNIVLLPLITFKVVSPSALHYLKDRYLGYVHRYQMYLKCKYTYQLTYLPPPFLKIDVNGGSRGRSGFRKKRKKKKGDATLLPEPPPLSSPRI
ncbi:hypothetical protein F4775DRAFT_532563 [Biscogniauxia sp. FL1348]|nr:hypothetical protein F4775DRAFT_532563 [Biscogniauxia sp. FL1348]